MARKAPDHINRLVGAQQYRLMQYVEKDYTISQKTDIEFAGIAAAALNFSVSKANVAGCRDALGIISNRELARQEKAQPTKMFERVAALEAAVASLTRRMDAWEHTP